MLQKMIRTVSYTHLDVYKRQGEKLTGVAGEEGNIQFLYTNAAFAGAKYKIYAAEDIHSQDKQTKIYQAGDLAGELETKEDGSCSSDMLHPVSYTHRDVYKRQQLHCLRTFVLSL